MAGPRKPAILIALAALALWSRAQAQQDACITHDELAGLLLFALPDVVESAGTACRPALRAGAFLAGDTGPLVKQYREAQPGAWRQARSAFLKLPGPKGRDGGIGALAGALPDAALQPFASGIVRQMVATAIKPDDCATFDQAVRLLSPLPPENIAGIIALVFERANRPHNGSIPTLPLCATAAVATTDH